MAGLSLKVLLELQKKGFDRNIAAVKSGLNSLKRTVMGITSAFVGGLGLNQLVSSFKKTATELSQVEATLRNVSDSYMDYSQNLEYVRKIANQYGQDMGSLVGTFAKFSSAAKGAGMEMAQQQRIFSSLTRAAGAFHLSADQTASVMLAVEQMISKGVVASEELRRQLSNVLPGSFQAMANAAQKAGIIATNSQQALMDAMKQGQVVASKVLPEFANELDRITANANFDSLVSSLNRLSNSWMNFVKESQFTGFYQKMVDGLSSALDSLGQHFNAIIKTVANLGGSIAAAFAIKKLSKVNLAYIDSLKTRYTSANVEVKKLIGSLDAMNTQLTNLKTGNIQNLVMQFSLADAKAAGLSNEMRTLAFQEEQLGNSTAMATLKRRDAQKLLNYRILEGKKALLAAGQEASAFGGKLAKSTTIGGRALLGLGGAAKKVAGLFASIWQVAVITAVFAAINKVIGALKEQYKWSKKIKDIENNSVDNAKTLNADTQGEFDKAEGLYKIYEDQNTSLLTKQQALKEINTLLGLSNENMLELGTSAETVRKKIDSWKNVKEADTVAQQMEDAIQQAAIRASELERRLVEITTDPQYGEVTYHLDEWGVATETVSRAARKLYREEAKVTRELEAQRKAYKDLVAAGTGSASDFIGPPAPPGLGGGAGGGKKTEAQTAVSNALDEYNKKAKDLENKYKNNIMTSQQYQKELANERYNVLQDIGVYENLEGVVASLGDTYQDTFNKIKAGAKKATGGGGGQTDPLLEAFKKYADEKKKIDNLFKNGFIDEKTHNEKTLDLIEDLEEVVGSQEDVEGSVKKLGDAYLILWNAIEAGKPALKDLKNKFDEDAKNAEEAAEEAKKSAEKLAEGKDELAKAIAKQPGEYKDTRDTTFDYKKSQNDIDKDNADAIKDYVKNWEEYVDTLEKIIEKYGDLGGAATEALDKAKAALKDAMAASNSSQATAAISEIIEDMTELKEKVLETGWDNFTGLVGGFEGVASAIENCDNAFKKLDESEANFFDGLKAGFSIIDGFITLVETINNVVMLFSASSEAYHKLQEANKKKEIAMDVATAAAAKASAAAKTEGAARSVAASAAEAAASQSAASAEATKAAAGAASSVANIPYLGPILAVAAIASVVGALLVAFSKFAKGGIVGGAKTQGDQNVIRANSGEMILNKAQQGNLFRMINNGGSGGKVEFELRGDRLVGAINNYNSRKRG